ncbi:unnamed protein product [Auanema sp. JU1783]|nr:unnamed protein product [Auanema sp. JU1783]
MEVDNNPEVGVLPPDIEKLRRSVVQYVDQNDLRIRFWDWHNPFQDVDEMLCIHAVVLFSKMKDVEQKYLVNQLIFLVQQSRAEPLPTNVTYERVIDHILLFAMKEQVLPMSTAIGGVILTADFTLKTGMSSFKWDMIMNYVESMDLKGMRHIFKTLIETQLVMLPQNISFEQRKQLIPVENLLLFILNKVPPIFTMSEISRCDVRMHMFPRIVVKLSEIKAYFRPLADLCFAIGKCFMYPILLHPHFNPMSASWRVHKNSTALCARYTYLPNRKEVCDPQNYLFYMIIKQPRGKEVLGAMLKTLDEDAQYQIFDGLLSILISDTMAAVEELPVNAEIPRYQWDNLLAIIIFAMNNKQTNASSVVAILHQILEKRQYRKARDEVMWLMLQVVGSFNTALTTEHIEKLAALHKLLYNEDFKSTYNSEHPSQLVRFMSTACMYILLEGKEGLPEPSDSLAVQIKFIRNTAAEDTDDQSLMTLLTNAYRSDNPIVRKVLRNFSTMLEGQSGDEPFFLPYNKHANNRLAPFELQLIDSFALRAKLHLLQVCAAPLRSTMERYPSPAIIETYAKLLYTVDFDFGFKHLVQLYSKTLHSPQGGTDYRDHLYIMSDLFTNRLTNMPLPPPGRETLLLTILAAMHTTINPSKPANAELYLIGDQILMRQFCWSPFTETLTLGTSFIPDDRSVSSRLCQPEKFETPDFHVCPEISRILFISVMRTIKILGVSISHLTEDPNFFQTACTKFTWGESQLQSFPAICRTYTEMVDKSTDVMMSEERRNAVHSDFVQMQGLPEDSFVGYMTEGESIHTTIFCVIFRALMENMDISRNLPSFYQILNRCGGRELVIATNWLSEYVVQQCGDAGQDVFQSCIRVLINMMFELHMVKFDRFLLSLILHPSNDQKAQVALLISQYLLETSEVKERFTMYTTTVPKRDVKAAEFFSRLGDFHRKYPEYAFSELEQMAGDNLREPVINPTAHFPIYYGSIMERLLPICDFAISRALELPNVDSILSSFLKALGPLYKYHPCPITFVYTVLHTMHNSLGQQPRARQFVLNIFIQRDDVQLTETFLSYNHQKHTLEDILTELIQRIIECSDFILKPPSYVSQDWRFSELTPSAQALYLSCIELLASPHSPTHIVPAMVSLLTASPQVQQRPYTTLNAVALILTALPDVYGEVLQQQFIEVLEKGEMEDLKFEEIVHDNFEERIHLHMTNRALTVNTLLQAYWTHGNNLGVGKFTNFFLDECYSRIKTENDLWYFIRLMLPLQQWVFEKDKMKHSFNECLRQVSGIIKKIGELSEKGVEFQHGLILCDILYHLKYLFSGDAMAIDAEQVFPKFPKYMQDHLKYYITPTHQRSDEDNHNKTAGTSHDISHASKSNSTSNPVEAASDRQ